MVRKMVAKLIVQLVTAGVQIVGRAFSKALREEIAKSRAAASQRASKPGADSSQTSAGKDKPLISFFLFF